MMSQVKKTSTKPVEHPTCTRMHWWQIRLDLYYELSHQSSKSSKSPPSPQVSASTSPSYVSARRDDNGVLLGAFVLD